MENAQRNEIEIRSILKKCLSEDSFKGPTATMDAETFVLLAYAWDLDAMKDVLKSFNIDT